MWCMAQLWALSCGLEWVAGVSHGGVGAARRVDRRRFSVRTPPAPPRVPYDMGLYPKCDLTCRSGSIICFVVGRSALWTKINVKIGKQRLSGLLGRKGAHYGGPVTGKSPGVTGIRLNPWSQPMSTRLCHQPPKLLWPCDF